MKNLTLFIFCFFTMSLATMASNVKNDNLKKNTVIDFHQINSSDLFLSKVVSIEKNKTKIVTELCSTNIILQCGDGPVETVPLTTSCEHIDAASIGIIDDFFDNCP